MNRPEHNPTVRVVRFLITLSAAGIVLAALLSKPTWDSIVVILASR